MFGKIMQVVFCDALRSDIAGFVALSGLVYHGELKTPK